MYILTNKKNWVSNFLLVFWCIFAVVLVQQYIYWYVNMVKSILKAKQISALLKKTQKLIQADKSLATTRQITCQLG